MQHCTQDGKKQWVFVQLSALWTRHKGCISCFVTIFNAKCSLVFANLIGKSRDCWVKWKLDTENGCVTMKSAPPNKNPLSIRILNVKLNRAHCLDVLVPATKAESGNHLLFVAMKWTMQELDCSQLLNSHKALQQGTSSEKTSPAKPGLQVTVAHTKSSF